MKKYLIITLLLVFGLTLTGCKDKVEINSHRVFMSDEFPLEPTGIDTVTLTDDGKVTFVFTDEDLISKYGKGYVALEDIVDFAVLPYGNAGWQAFLFIGKDSKVSIVSTNKLMNEKEIVVVKDEKHKNIIGFEGTVDESAHGVNLIDEKADRFAFDTFLIEN